MSLIGYGATVEINDGGGSSFAIVPDLVDIDPPDEEEETVQSKRLDLANRTITGRRTLRDPGTFSFTWEMNKTTWDRLTGLKGTAKSFRVTIQGDNTPTDDVVRTVPGFITGNKPSKVVADEIVEVTTTVYITGPSS